MALDVSLGHQYTSTRNRIMEDKDMWLLRCTEREGNTQVGFIPGTSLGVCLLLRVHGSGRWSLGLSHNWGFKSR